MTQVVERLPEPIMVVGDDLYTTNSDTVAEGIKKNWANSLLLKVNQIGTITEAVEAAKLIFNENMDVIVSHRSGETTSTIISDLAVGIGAKYIKTGAPARGERIAKYNRLLQLKNYYKNLQKIEVYNIYKKRYIYYILKQTRFYLLIHR